MSDPFGSFKNTHVFFLFSFCSLRRNIQTMVDGCSAVMLAVELKMKGWKEQLLRAMPKLRWYQSQIILLNQTRKLPALIYCWGYKILNFHGWEIRVQLFMGQQVLKWCSSWHGEMKWALLCNFPGPLGPCNL